MNPTTENTGAGDGYLDYGLFRAFAFFTLSTMWLFLMRSAKSIRWTQLIKVSLWDFLWVFIIYALPGLHITADS